MANDKKITIDWSEIDQTLYGIVRRELTGEFLDDVAGTFATTATDIYISLVEDGTVRGRYEVTENRTVWPDGQYLAAIYKQGGASPSTSADQIIGSGELNITNDIEIDNSFINSSINSLDLELDNLALETTLLAVSADIQNIEIDIEESGLSLESTSQAIREDITGLSKVIVQPIQGNFSYAKIKKQEVEIKRGDSPSISYNLNDNITPYTVWFTAKETYDSTTFAMSAREITSDVISATNGTGTIELNTLDTTIPVGDYIGEIQLRDGSTIITPSEFRIHILDSIF